MKRFKKVIALVAAIALCVVPFFSNSITAKAEGATTYSLKYVESLGEWRFQEGTWSESGFDRELYYMYQDIKDGDIIVITGGHKDLTLELNVRLSNFTSIDCGTIVVKSPGIDNVYILNQSTVAINGDVTYAEVYDYSNVNFNNNVGTLKVLSSKDDNLHANINALGTVNYLCGSGANYKLYEYYNFVTDSLRITNGYVNTDESKYSKEPVAAPAPAPSTPAAGNSSEYDEVPKTADMHFNPLWLVGMAVICFVGAYKLREE